MSTPPLGPYTKDVCIGEAKACGMCPNCTMPQADPWFVPVESQMDRIEALLERIVETLEGNAERDGYDSALERWRLGQGKHPDD